MQSQTPSFPLPLPALNQGEARIGVAIMTFPHSSTVLWWQILGNAMEAGLKRSQVEVIEHGSYFNSLFVVCVFSVKWAARGDATESLKRTLCELELTERATIASETADQDWRTLLPLGGIALTFDKVFLKPSDIENGRKEFEQSFAESTRSGATVMEHLKAYLAAQQAGGQTDPL